MMINTPKGKLGRTKIFSDNFKVQIALEYLNGDHGYGHVAKYEQKGKLLGQCYCRKLL